MELFKLVGKIAIEGVDKAQKDIQSVGKSAKTTASSVSSSNKSISSSNKSTGSSWSSLKSSVEQYKSQGMSTSQAWRQAALDMKSSTETASGGIVGSFKKIFIAVGTFLAVDKIIAFGQGCLQAAADAQAMESQFSQVFGDLEGKAGKSLSGIASKAGISENRMKGSFTKIAAFAKTTGMDTESSLKLSERAMIAVADSAAFYDRSLEETTESLQSFLKGNYENDAALGLSCTETTRNAAANKLYGKSFKELSEEQKQLTLLKMVEDANKASGALGQAARESDTWTNVIGNLKQGWTDFQAVIGNAILPTAIQVVKRMANGLAELAEKTKNAIQWAKEHEATMKVIGIAFATVGAAILGYNIYINSSTIAMKAFTLAQKLATAATTAFGSVMSFITSPVTLVILAIGALVAAVVVMYNKFDWFKKIVDKVKESMVNGWNKIKESVTGSIDRIKERLSPLVSAIKENLVGAFNDMRERANAAKDRLVELGEKFKPVVNIISGAFSKAMSGASGLLGNVKDKMLDLAAGALKKLNDGITTARNAFDKISAKAGELWDRLDPLVTLIRDNLVKALKNMKEPLQSIWDSFKMVADVVMNDLLPLLKDLLMPVWDSLKSALGGVAGIMGGVFVSAIGVAIGVINGIVKAVAGFVEAFSGIVKIVSNVMKLVVGIFKLDGDMIMEAVRGIGDGIVDVFSGLWSAIKGFVKGFVDGVVGFFKGLWDTLVGHSIVPDIIDGIVNCFKGLWNKAKGFVSNFKNGVVNAFNNVKDKAVNAFNTAKNKVVTAASNIKDKAVSSFNSMKDKTVSAFNNARDKASSAFSTLKSKVSSAASSTKDKAVSAWNTLKSKTSSAFSSTKDKASSAFSTMKSKISSAASSMLSNTSSKFSSMKSKITSAMSGAKSSLSSHASTMTSKMKNMATSAYSTISSKFGSIKSKISSVMSSAKSTVSNAVSKLKSAFNFKWSLPKLKLPHISVSGGKAPYGIGGAGSLPKFSIKWYKKAYDNPMLLNEPTIFGYSAATGKFLGAGDGNGTEVVSGSNTLMNMISAAVAEQNEAVAYYLQKIIAVLAEYFPQFLDEMGKPLCWNPDEAAAALAVPMDKYLGRIQQRKDRGR